LALPIERVESAEPIELAESAEPIEPAYRRFRVRPRPGGGVTSAAAAHESPYGRIEVRWSLHGDAFDLDVTVPPGTTAETTLPDGTVTDLSPGHHHLGCSRL
jgi:alpha-L-rhamnosidase